VKYCTYSAVLGQVLKHLREKRGLPQAAIDAQNRVSRVENGQPIDVPTFVDWCAALEISPAAVFASVDAARVALRSAGVKVVMGKPDGTVVLSASAVGGILELRGVG